MADSPTRRAELDPAARDVARCWWAAHDALLRDYHDHEWGRPVHDDRALFEKLCLEGFQVGLSWRTILAKRPALRAAFADFDAAALVGFDHTDVERLLADAGIVRHRAKIEAVLTNAHVARSITEETGSLAALLWSFAPRDPPVPVHSEDVRASAPESVALARELRRRGWRFIGPTTAYAFQQAMGMVNDHLAGCPWRASGRPG